MGTPLAFEPDPPQAAILRDVSRRIIICGSRQWATVAALAVHHMLHNARARCLVLSSSGRQSGEFVRKAKGLPSPLGPQSPQPLRRHNASGR